MISLPRIKRTISKFLLDDCGGISKKNIVGAGILLAFASLSSSQTQAGECNHPTVVVPVDCVNDYTGMTDLEPLAPIADVTQKTCFAGGFYFEYGLQLSYGTDGKLQGNWVPRSTWGLGEDVWAPQYDSHANSPDHDCDCRTHTEATITIIDPSGDTNTAHWGWLNTEHSSDGADFCETETPTAFFNTSFNSHANIITVENDNQELLGKHTHNFNEEIELPFYFTNEYNCCD